MFFTESENYLKDVEYNKELLEEIQNIYDIPLLIYGYYSILMAEEIKENKFKPIYVMKYNDIINILKNIRKIIKSPLLKKGRQHMPPSFFMLVINGNDTTIILSHFIL